MREILFRGKRIYTGEWESGNFVKAEKLDGSRRHEYFIVEEQADGTEYEVIHETVGQYTGLKDKNGKKIFEGDILEGSAEIEGDSFKFRECVKWEECSWVVQEFGYSSDILDAELAAECEVVGNIYDNPELMEEEQ